MDLFGNFDFFGNSRNLNDRIRELNEKLRELGVEPVFLTPNNYKSESGVDSNGEWTKSTYTSEDGTTHIITITSGFKGLNNEISKIKSNDIDYLEKELSKAIESQDFEFAVKLRDKIKSLKNVEEEILNLESKLNNAIKVQNFELCIELRNKINELKNI